MSKITRKTQKIFGSVSGLNQIAQFGSFAQGSPAFTTDPAAVQTNTYLAGWFSAVLGDNAPAMEDMNALCFLYAYQLAYVMQTGVPEWDSATTYFIGSIVNDGTGLLYCSLTDTNLNNALSSTANWRQIGGAIMTTLGDTTYGGVNGAVTRLAGNTSATPAILTQTGTGSVSAAPAWRLFKAPSVQRFLSGSGTYTTPANVLYIKVRMAGGGGGGGGTDGVSGASGATGGVSTFGTSLLTANGGVGGGGDDATGGAGGTVTVAAGPITLIASPGGRGNDTTHGAFTSGSIGGSNNLAGGGASVTAQQSGYSAVANTGGGGGGAGSNSASTTSAGAGGAGGYIEALIESPAGSYAYAVGAGGAGGVSTQSGGAGAAGIIIVEEFYQ